MDEKIFKPKFIHNIINLKCVYYKFGYVFNLYKY